MQNDYPKLGFKQLEFIAHHMDDELCEVLHIQIAPCHPGEFLTAYLDRDPDFPVEQFDTEAEHDLNAAEHHNPDAFYLRDLIDQASLSQRAAARRIGISERTMRDYLNPAHPSKAPYAVQYCLEALASE